jgi:hypothetical protein
MWNVTGLYNKEAGPVSPLQLRTNRTEMSLAHGFPPNEFSGDHWSSLCAESIARRRNNRNIPVFPY